MQRLLGDALIDLWLTDPPYNVAYVQDSQNKRIQNDSQESHAFEQFLTDAFSAAYAAMKPGAAFYIWFAATNHLYFDHALQSVGLSVREELIWNKNTFCLGRQDYQWKHEPCLYGWKEGAAHYFINQRNKVTVFSDVTPTLKDLEKLKKEEMLALLKELYALPMNVIDCDKPAVSTDHPTMKPVELFGQLMNNSSRIGDNVLDTFGGSGTSLICAEQLHRNCFMMELDPHYCDVIMARWEKLTGEKAQKL